MSIAPNPLNDISRVYLEQVFESAVPGKPAEKLKTDRNMFSIPKDEQEAARERLKAKTAAKRKAAMEALDPVGQEDADIDNDGDTDSSDKYLHKRRKAIGKAIKKEKMKESFSNWRQDLAEVMTDVESEKEIKEKKVTNKVKTSAMGGGIKLGEAVEELGGTLIEMVEIDEVDFVVESVYSDLLEEGYSEDDIEEAIEYALIEAKVTFGHDTPTGEKKRGNLVKAVGRLARQKLSSKVRGAKKAAASAVASGARKVAKGALGVARKMEGGKEAPKAAERKPSTYRGAGAGTKEKVSSGSYTPPTKKKAEKPADPWEGSATTPPKAKTKKAAPKAKAPAKKKKSSKLDDLLASVRSEETSVERLDRIAKEKVAARASAAKKEKEDRAKSASAFQAHKKEVLAKGDRPVDALDSWQKKKMNKEEVNQIDEKITAKTDMGAAIKDFYASKSPQLAGRTKEERRKAAIAAVLTARRGGRKLGEQMDDETVMPPSTSQVDDKKMEQQRKRIQMQKIKDLTVRLSAARKGVY